MKINFYGTLLSLVNQKNQIKELESLIKREKASYVTYSNVHTVTSSRKDFSLREATNNADIASLDGMPLVWIAKLKRCKDIDKCSGPDMMMKIFQLSNDKGYSNYFYGGQTEEILKKMKTKLNKEFPNLKIAGMYSPPFRQLTEEEEQKVIEEINATSPDFIWVGLGAPKQEIWMYEHKNKIKRGVMLGVGAAFNFYTETVERAPIWMQKSGLEWFYRLIKEPKRLWKRYFVTNILFVWYLIRYGVEIKEGK